MNNRIVSSILALVVTCAGIEGVYAGNGGSSGYLVTTDTGVPADWREDVFEQDKNGDQPHQSAEREVEQMAAAVAVGDEPVCGEHGETCRLVDELLRLVSRS